MIDNIPGSGAPGSSQDELLLSPVTKASRSDSRTSFGSVQDRDSSGCSRLAGSTESLFDFRRQSLGVSSQTMLDTLSVEEIAELSMSGTLSSPSVPTVVMMCIRHLEQNGLNTVGIFRVSSSKKRVKQVIKPTHSLSIAAVKICGRPPSSSSYAVVSLLHAAGLAAASQKKA